MWERLNKLIKPNGAIVLFGSEPFSSALRMSNIKNYKHQWIWNKKQSGSFQNAKYAPLKLDENIMIFNNGGKVIYYPQMRKGKMRKRGGANKKSGVVGSGWSDGYEDYSDLYFPTNIIEIANKRIGTIHPTQKPVALMEYLIKTYTNEGELVLDFTAGSFTTAVACVNTKRKFIGIEMEEKYFEIGKQRVQEALVSMNIIQNIDEEWE